MTYTTRRARIDAEKAEQLALRARRNKKFSLGIAGIATAASASLFGMAPANASMDDAPAPAAATSSASNTSSSDDGSYTVQAGDTLAKIASSQGVSLDSLLSANNMSASDVIYPGQTLQLSGSGSSDSSDSSADAAVGPDAGVGPNAGGSTSTSNEGDSTVQTASATTSNVEGTGSKAAAIDKAVEIANSGASYSLGANGPSAYDCSSLTQTAFASAGVDIPRVSSDQYAQAPTKDSLSNVQPGDLVFWSNNGSSSGIYHVAVYVGDGQIAQARNPQAGISVDSLDHYKQYNPPMDSVGRY